MTSSGEAIAPGRRGWPNWAADVALAGVLAVLAFFGTVGATANQGTEPTPWAAVGLAVLAAAVMVGWRIAPQVTFVAVTVLNATYLAAGFAFGPIMITQAIASFSLALRTPVRAVLKWSAGLAGVLAVAVLVRSQVLEEDRWLEANLRDFAAVASWVVVPLAVGAAIRIRRRAAVDVREASVRRAASEERLRMAQDVHDVVGHGLAVIAMQAGVALHVLDRDPAKARESLEAIRDTSREALDGLRGELRILTADDRRSGDSAPRRPTPTLRDLDVLLDRVRAGGIRVEAEVSIPDGVTSAVDGAAFRIIQESLTNVLRHSGADTARVRIGASGPWLVVEVTDDGPAEESQARATEPPGPGSSAVTDTSTSAATSAATGTGASAGTGIDGMRARATAVGGTVTAGPLTEGGFVVRAELPLEPASPASAGPGADHGGRDAGATPTSTHSGAGRFDRAEGDPS